MKPILASLFFLFYLSASAQNNIFQQNGNVGIGINDPSEKLVVRGNISVVDGNSFQVSPSNGLIWGNTKILTRGYSNDLDFSELLVPGYGVNNANIRLYANGNVGIGTATPREKLSVNGNIRAHGIKVETQNWPDYVFAKDYELPSLLETEKLIKEKGHLPGMPSAAEVKSNGVDLGEMNAKLLKSLEELTLQVIELNKTVKNQQLEINALKKK